MSNVVKTAGQVGNPEHAAWRRHLLLAGLAGIAYFVLASATILLTTNGHIATVWPPDAVIVAMLAAISMKHWPPYLIAGFMANAAANMMTVDSVAAPLIYGLINMGEAAMAATMLRWLRIDADMLGDIRSVVRFLVIGVVPPAISALGGAITAHFLFGEAFARSYSTWYVSDALGLLIFTPFFMALRSGGISRWIGDLGRRRLIEASGLLALVSGVAIIVFLQPAPMLFTVVAPVILIATRLGRHGTKIAVTIVAVVGAIATAHGLGPVSAHFPDSRDEAHVLQFFLATLLLTALPVSAELSSRQRLARKLKVSESGLRLLASGSDVLVSIDSGGTCRQASNAASALLGVDGSALIGCSLIDVALPEDAARMTAALAAAASTAGSTIYCDFRPALRPDRWMECALKALVDEKGNYAGAIGAVRDITDRRRRELAATRAASIDSLTGALTRAAFFDSLDQRLAHALRQPLTLIMIDVDLFKHVNDRHGHPAGDKVLSEIVNRLRARMRESDMIGRLGGDEFAVLLDGARYEHGRAAAAAFANLVKAEPVQIRDGITQMVSISCGVAEAEPTSSRDILLQRADDALMKEKRKVRGMRG